MPEDTGAPEEWGDQPAYDEREHPAMVTPATTVTPPGATLRSAFEHIAQRPMDTSHVKALAAVRARRRQTEEGRKRLLDIDCKAGRNIVTITGTMEAGSFDEAFPECPHCHTVHRRAVRHPFLEAMVKAFTGDERIVWALALPCDGCIAAAEQKTERNKAESRRAELERAGFAKAMLDWTFNSYPNQGSDWLKRAKDYVAAGARHDVIIWGNPGVGKTGLGVSILRELWRDGRSKIRFLRATEFMLMLRDGMRPKAYDEGATEMQILQHLAAVDYLMVDDVSSLNGTAYQDEMMSYLIDMRQKENKPTILTLNLRVPRNGDPSKVLVQFFGELIADRMREYGEAWHISGASMRRSRS
jgi:DNA replication protein DnaC